MSQFSYTKKPEWNADGLRPNHVNTNVYASDDGWVAPLAGTTKLATASLTWLSNVATVTVGASATFTGTIANNILNASAVTGTITKGQTIIGAGVVDGVKVIQQGIATGLNCSTSAANPAILTVGSMASVCPFIAGMTVTGTGVGAGVTIVSGTYPTFTLSAAVTTPGTGLTITGATAAGGAGIYLLTSSSTVANGASLTSETPHNLGTGTEVLVYGVTPAAYNGSQYITVTGRNTFTYPLTTNPGGSASVQGYVGLEEVMVAIRGLDAIYADLGVVPTFSAAAAYTAAAFPHFVTNDVMKVQLTVSEPIQVDFTTTTRPYVNITVGGNTRRAYYSGSGSTSTLLDFEYVVVAGDVTTAGQVTIGTAVQANGATFIDVAGVGGTQGAPFTPQTFVAPAITTWYTN